MAVITRWNVQVIFGSAPLYLEHIAGIGMRWSTDPEAAFEYEDREEAEADATANGGEVFKFERVERRTDGFRRFHGHNHTARLERRFGFAPSAVAAE